MFTDINHVSFILGMMYGIIMLSIMYSWNECSSREFIKHDNTKGKCGTDTYEIKRASLSRATMIVVASSFWPLTLALMLLYGLLCIPVLIYKKSAS